MPSLLPADCLRKKVCFIAGYNHAALPVGENSQLDLPQSIEDEIEGVYKAVAADLAPLLTEQLNYARSVQVLSAGQRFGRITMP